MANEKIVEAVREAIKNSKERKFLESVEIAINLKDVDLKDPKKRINLEIVLPHGRGKDVKIGVFASGETALKAKNSADIVILPEEIDKIAEDKKKVKKLANSVDFFLAETPLMPIVGKKLGQILGPRGKMPKPIPSGADPTPTINLLKRSVVARSRDKKTFHVPVGSKNMEVEKIAENIEEVLKNVASKLERGFGNIESVYVKTTMGPAVKIDLKDMKR